MPSDSETDNEERTIIRHEPTLAFHKIMPGFSYGSTNFSPRRLDRLLHFLIHNGFRFDDNNGGEAGSTFVRLTFDDGYSHLSEFLPPLIDKYGLRPIVFVPTAYIGKSNKWDYSFIFRDTPHLDTNAIRELAQMGVTFGSHGHSHRPLTSLTDAKLKEELSSSKAVLEDALQVAVESISYPFGRFNRRVIDTACESGYNSGYTMNFPTENDSQMAEGRFAVYFYDTPFTVRQKLGCGGLYRLEQVKANISNRLSYGTGLYRFLSRQ
ncbi:MAG: polysaccharide deacetylase family protein [Candidatus Zixiibacteriota bacterium]